MNERPNILWICTDQQRFDTIRALGSADARTPNLDRLVESGVAFTHTYCQNPICTPSRASFMTGRYPGNIRVNRNGNEYFPREAEATLVSRLLRDSGYHCGLVGKLHLSGCANRVEPRVDDGFEYFKWSHSSRNLWPTPEHDYAQWLRDAGHDPEELLKLRPVEKAAPIIPEAAMDNVPPELHHIRWHGERSLEFIDSAKRPWFLLVNFFEPHPPFNPPYEYYRRYDPSSMEPVHFLESDLATQWKIEEAGVDFQTRAKRPDDVTTRERRAAYYSMIEFLDAEIGRIIEHLEQSGMRENTVVVFSSDHGEMLGDHGLVLKGCRFYEGLVRVPNIFSMPGPFRSGLRSSALVEMIDIAPTLLEISGTPVPSQMQGRSLLPLLSGDWTSHRSFVRCEYADSLDMPDHTVATMYRDERWKLCLYHSAGIGELYDLQEDPWEHTNLWEEDEYLGIRSSLQRSAAAADWAAIDLGSPRTMPY